MGWDVPGCPGMSQVILGPTGHVRPGTCGGIMGWDVPGCSGMSQVILGPTGHVRLGTCGGIMCWDVTPQDVLGCPGISWDVR